MLERLAAPRVAIPAQGRSYGYGLIDDRRRGPRLVLHTGARTGYGSTILIAPEQRVAVAVISSRTGAVMSDAAFAGIEPFVTVTEVTPSRTPVPIAPEAVAEIAGTYVNGPLTVTLADEGGRLVLRLAARTLPVVPVGVDRFHVPDGAQLEQFVIVRDAQGAPKFLCAETWALRRRN